MIKEIVLMQKETIEWMKRRPLLDLRPTALQLVVQNEEEELKQAIEVGDSKQIKLEIGDVLFSRIAAGMNIQGVIDICNKYDLDPLVVFNDTQNKNRVNYAWIFFSKHSPFDNAADAMRCLRLLRKKYKTTDKLDEVWLKHDHYVNDEMAFYDKYWITKRSREFMKKELQKIKRSKDKENAKIAEDLIQKGVWDDIGFIIENNNS